MKNKVLAAVLTLLAAFAVVVGVAEHYRPHTVQAQANLVPNVLGNPNAVTYPGGSFYASPLYSTWRGLSESAITTTGSSTTVIIGPDIIILPDGRQARPFGYADNLNTPVTFDIGATSETITPTSVSPASCPLVGDFTPPAQCVSFTGTFTNTHGVHTYTASGTQGINEAIADAGSNGGGDVFFYIDSGTLTLNTGGQGTTFGVNIPTRSYITGSSLLVKTTITGCAGGWSLGYTSGTEFTAANTTLTAATTTDSSTINAAVAFNAAATKPEVFCTTGAATAGVVHARVWGYKHVAPLF